MAEMKIRTCPALFRQFIPFGISEHALFFRHDRLIQRRIRDIAEQV